MPLPNLDENSRKRPLCYDPYRDKFILYDDLIAKDEKIIPIDSLSEDDLKKLIIKRWEVLPESTTVQAISGPPYRRDDVIRAIEQDEAFGRMTVQAEKNQLKGLLEEIHRELDHWDYF